MNCNEIMQRLKETRVERGLSLEEVAERGRWANESIPRRLERNGENPTLRSVQRYADAVGVRLSMSVVKTRVLSFFNHAGGVGKSSAVRDLGYVLSDLGFRVLLVDADPQANLTAWLGITEAVELERTIYPAAMGEEPALPEPRQIHGMNLIPATLELARLETQLVGQIMGITRLGRAVRELEGYDFVLLDPPPSLGQLSASAVIAAQHCVVPVPTNIKGFQGIRTVIDMIRDYRQANPELSVAMFLLTQFDARTNHDRESLRTLQSDLTSIAPVSPALGWRPAIYRDASLSGLPVPLDSPASKADEEVRAATGALLEAVGVKVDV